MVAQSARFDLGEILLVLRIAIRARPGMIVASCCITAPAAGLGFVAFVRIGLDIGWSIPGFVRRSLRVVLGQVVADRLARDRFRTASGGMTPRRAAPHAGAAVGFGFRVTVGA